MTSLIIAFFSSTKNNISPILGSTCHNNIDYNSITKTGYHVIPTIGGYEVQVNMQSKKAVNYLLGGTALMIFVPTIINVVLAGLHHIFL